LPHWLPRKSGRKQIGQLHRACPAEPVRTRSLLLSVSDLAPRRGHRWKLFSLLPQLLLLRCLRRSYDRQRWYRAGVGYAVSVAHGSPSIFSERFIGRFLLRESAPALSLLFYPNSA
jgi:hypothetical protein